jgi:hypothetical protein
LYRLTPFRPLFLVFFACLSAARAAGPAANGLPPWLHLGVEFRGRFEALTALDFVRDNNNIYYLHRIRGTIGIQPAPWLRFLVQPQNVRAPFHRKPVPSNVQDTFDFHQWFGELRKNDWQVRVGRQEINFGAQRLIGSANWGNSSRSYEGIRATRTRNRVQLDAFASMVAVVDNTRLNPVLASGNQIHGVHLSAARSPREGVFESYAFWKISNTETFQDRRGRTSHFTNGLRALGKLPRRFDYNLEMAFQAGELAGQTHRAWAGYWNLGYTLASAERSPRLVAIYSFASGDNRAADGRSGTFDQLYPTNHARIPFLLARHPRRRLLQLRRPAGRVESRRNKRHLDYEIREHREHRRLHSAAMCTCSACLWAEGPAWNGVGRATWRGATSRTTCRLRWLEEDGHVSVLPQPRYGQQQRQHVRLRNRGQLRQIASSTAISRRVVRYEHNGKITVLADKWQGKPLNAPQRRGGASRRRIWFTDPGYGSLMNYEGNKGPLQSRKPSIASTPRVRQDDPRSPTRSSSRTACASRPTTRSSTSPTPAPRTTRRPRRLSRSGTSSTARRCATG